MGMSRWTWWELGLILLRYFKNLCRTFLRTNPATEGKLGCLSTSSQPLLVEGNSEVLIPSHPWPVPLGPTTSHGQRMLSGRESEDTSFILKSWVTQSVLVIVTFNSLQPHGLCSQPALLTDVSSTAGRFFTTEPSQKPLVSSRNLLCNNMPVINSAPGSVSISHLVVPDSVRPGTVAAKLLCPWNSPGKNAGVVSHSLLQGIFPTQGSNLALRHCRWILFHLSQRVLMLIIQAFSRVD